MSQSISEILLYQIKNENLQHRLNTVKNIGIIAVAYGKERTIGEVIPLLLESLSDEDEVLLNLAAKIPDLVKVIGVDEIPALVPILDEIARVEEMLVREEAVESLLKLLQQIEDDKVVIDSFMPLIKSLAEDDWFSPKISACALIPSVYPRVNKRCKRQLREIFQSLASDDTPMVRRANATYLKDFAANIEKHYLITDITAIFATLTQDDQDTVRVIGVSNAIAIGKKISDDQKLTILVPVIDELSVDPSWKVRYELGKRFTEITEDVFGGAAPTEIIDIFMNLVKDSELEVRSSVVDKVSVVCKNVPPSDFMANIFPALKNLVNDESPYVRKSLASDICAQSQIIGIENSLESLVPVILILLRDESSDVRYHTIANLDKIRSVIGIQEVSNRLLNAIITLAEDSQWRVRNSIISIVPDLASNMNSEEFAQMVPLLNSWLTAITACVRLAATEILPQLVTIYGPEWMVNNILQKLMSEESPNYRQVNSVLNAITATADKLTEEQLTSLVPYVLKTAENPVPNTRIRVSKCLGSLLNRDISSIQDSIQSALKTLVEDSDKDVKYEAAKALQLA